MKVLRIINAIAETILFGMFLIRVFTALIGWNLSDQMEMPVLIIFAVSFFITVITAWIINFSENKKRPSNN